jgi:ribosomal protein L14E/L6E/L27E
VNPNETKFQCGSIVSAKAGRDEGGLFVVLEIFRERGSLFALIADGKTRKLNSPKKKNIRHLSRLNTVISTENLTDKALRKRLNSMLPINNN